MLCSVIPRAPLERKRYAPLGGHGERAWGDRKEYHPLYSFRKHMVASAWFVGIGPGGGIRELNIFPLARS
jgi:hypothetical protein